jgi:hypothetical protein
MKNPVKGWSTLKLHVASSLILGAILGLIWLIILIVPNLGLIHGVPRGIYDVFGVAFIPPEHALVTFSIYDICSFAVDLSMANYEDVAY